MFNVARATPLWRVSVLGPGRRGRRWPSQFVLKHGVEDDRDDEKDDGDVEFRGDADEPGTENERQSGADSLQRSTALERYVVVARRTAGTD